MPGVAGERGERHRVSRGGGLRHQGQCFCHPNGRRAQVSNLVPLAVFEGLDFLLPPSPSSCGCRGSSLMGMCFGGRAEGGGGGDVPLPCHRGPGHRGTGRMEDRSPGERLPPLRRNKTEHKTDPSQMFHSVPDPCIGPPIFPSRWGSEWTASVGYLPHGPSTFPAAPLTPYLPLPRPPPWASVRPPPPLSPLATHRPAEPLPPQDRGPPVPPPAEAVPPHPRPPRPRPCRPLPRRRGPPPPYFLVGRGLACS